MPKIEIIGQENSLEYEMNITKYSLKDKLNPIQKQLYMKERIKEYICKEFSKNYKEKIFIAEIIDSVPLDAFCNLDISDTQYVLTLTLYNKFKYCPYGNLTIMDTKNFDFDKLFYSIRSYIQTSINIS